MLHSGGTDATIVFIPVFLPFHGLFNPLRVNVIVLSVTRRLVFDAISGL